MPKNLNFRYEFLFLGLLYPIVISLIYYLGRIVRINNNAQKKHIRGTHIFTMETQHQLDIYWSWLIRPTLTLFGTLQWNYSSL